MCNDSAIGILIYTLCAECVFMIYMITVFGIWYAQHCFTRLRIVCECIDMCTGKSIKFSVKHGSYARLKLLNHVAIYLFIRSEFSDLMLRLALPQPPHITASCSLMLEKRRNFR